MAGDGDGMHREEEILWQLAAVDDDRSATTESRDWSDDDLVAYRRGELDDEAAGRVERLLASDRRARHRLVELAGLDVAPPAAVRDRVLAALQGRREGGAVVDFEDRVPARRSRRTPRWLMPALAAAALLWVVLGPWGSADRSVVELPPEIAFELRVEGTSEVRSTEPSGGEQGEVATLAERRLRLVVEAVENAVAGLDYGVYARRGSDWILLGAADGVGIEVGRGTAVFEASAVSFVGKSPGRHALLLAVAPEGQLPTSFAVPNGSEPALVLADQSRGWVRRQIIHLVSPEGEAGDRGD